MDITKILFSAKRLICSHVLEFFQKGFIQTKVRLFKFKSIEHQLYIYMYIYTQSIILFIEISATLISVV